MSGNSSLLRRRPVFNIHVFIKLISKNMQVSDTIEREDELLVACLILKLNPPGAKSFEPPYIFYSYSYLLSIIDRSPNCFVALGQHVMAIFTLKWVHYDN